jgi:uncharacterized protein YeaO (DUF488 family)
MNKYYVIFKLPTASMDEWIKNVSADERKKQTEDLMKQWGAWQEKYKASIVDNGSPLGKTKTVTKDGITDSRNDLNYIMVIQAASHDEAAKIIAENPHLRVIPMSSADVMDSPHMGM